MSGILGAPNPFDATHGFTILSRGDAELRDGTTIGAVAAGGDLTVGPYEVTATPPAVLDGTPVAVLADGAISVEGPDDRLTIGAAAEVLAGDVDALDPATIDGAVAVASPDTFDRAFQGVFADLQARSSLLASLPVTVPATGLRRRRLWTTCPAPTSTWPPISTTVRPAWSTVTARTTSPACRASPSTPLRRPTTRW